MRLEDDPPFRKSGASVISPSAAHPSGETSLKWGQKDSRFPAPGTRTWDAASPFHAELGQIDNSFPKL